jgi:hypothetical protein
VRRPGPLPFGIAETNRSAGSHVVTAITLWAIC